MKLKKIMIIFLIIYILIYTLSTLNMVVYASNPLENTIKDAKDFIEGDVTTTVAIPITNDRLQSVSKIVSNILFVIAIGVALVTTAIRGISLMIQSAEEKAKVKEALVPLVVGMFVSFGAYGIWKIVVEIFSEL